MTAVDQDGNRIVQCTCTPAQGDTASPWTPDTPPPIPSPSPAIFIQHNSVLPHLLHHEDLHCFCDGILAGQISRSCFWIAWEERKGVARQGLSHQKSEVSGCWPKHGQILWKAQLHGANWDVCV